MLTPSVRPSRLFRLAGASPGARDAHWRPAAGGWTGSPKTLPDVPTEEELRAVLAARPDTLEGVRSQTLILVLADSGLRAS